MEMDGGRLITKPVLFMTKRMLSDQQEPNMFVSFMKMSNSCVENGNEIPGNYGKWISQPQHDSISTTIEEDPAEDSDGNDEPVEDATGADITDLDSDDDDAQRSSDFPFSSTNKLTIAFAQLSTPRGQRSFH
ncbi:hypothetical protein DAPPUDRAFT_245584 [Daphnia pulex]|uniref:Uncharacterized protein n=1 Tax=Daphnia pulex TaxID=6669 RepID=E9GNM6_DAPPU|nr:hypothetical protein DAPPUDRAFT_245584 [Daphnia pulex]|eukprot:EFX78937.1 hypothetical protein DAPPUDRAFT_245584 [Daphnia pulex]